MTARLQDAAEGTDDAIGDGFGRPADGKMQAKEVEKVPVACIDDVPRQALFVPDHQGFVPVAKVAQRRLVVGLVVHGSLKAFSIVQRVNQPPSTGTMAPYI